MSLIEIEEPDAKKYLEDKTEIVVGIDFGTTNSLIALSKNKKIKFAKDNKGNELIKTIVDINDNNLHINIHSIKRLLGKSKEEILSNPALLNLCQGLLSAEHHIPRIKVGEKLKTLPELAGMVFSHLKSIAETDFGEKIKKAVVTIPAYFDDSSKAAVMLAAEIAGLEVIRLLSEPTAAAYAYKLNNEVKGCYLVYDLGGGTFDVSVLNMLNGVLQVIAIGGDNMLGGDDMDLLLAEYLMQKNLFANINLAMLNAKIIKEHLSSEKLYMGENFELSKAEFEQIITPLIKRTIDIAKDTLYRADNQVDGIILVGGSTRIPLIKKMLEDKFKIAILSDIDPDRAVAYGAALQAENLTIHNGSLVIDVLPLSLGIELYSGVVEKIILRGSPLPSSVIKEFSTQVDNQTGVQFHIVQGEREMAIDCRSLARFELKLADAMKAGEPKIEVTFAVDADGLLSVSAIEKISGKSQVINIKPSYGLSGEEIKAILEDGFRNAEIDHQNKLLQETITEAKSLLYFLKNAIKENSEILLSTQIKKLQQDIHSLNLLIEDKQNKNQIALINEASQKLKKVVNKFNQTKFSSEINKMLIGKNIDNI